LAVEWAWVVALGRGGMGLGGGGGSGGVGLGGVSGGDWAITALGLASLVLQPHLGEVVYYIARQAQTGGRL
jgi:hypothetical protein